MKAIVTVPRIVALSISFAAAACSSLTSPPEPIAADTTTAALASAAPRASAPAPAASAPLAIPVQEKLQIVDDVVGKGKEAKDGDSISVHYVGTLANGTEFDSSRKRGTPFTFMLGKGNVIKGWDQGVAGMKVGGKRKLTIPPSLAYGERSQGRIPPNSTLQFEIELLNVNGGDKAKSEPKRPDLKKNEPKRPDPKKNEPKK
jgi:FKBP-type peptidyl-prolyl cis-trans isomerase